MARSDLLLAIDVGTGSVRAALVDPAGRVQAFAAREHEQIVPSFGRAEQRPRDWWEGAAASIRDVLRAVPDAAARVAAVCACGQMHGTVLVDAAGEPVLETAPLWNDKRTRGLVDRLAAERDAGTLLALAGNPPTVAWPAFKLAWLREHEPEAWARAARVLMPKDWVNFRLTGRQAIDRPEATTTYLLDARTGDWSDELLGLFGVGRDLMPEILEAADPLGPVTPEAAAATGLLAGTPVAVGIGDFPATLLGCGALHPGTGSDVTGTSTLITLLAERPVLDPTITNVRTADPGAWAAFTILDAGGDAMRWARRAFHEKALGYEGIVAKAAEAPPGCDGLLFLPYLGGQRLGRHANARAGFHGLASAHGLPHLHRAVMEGVAFAARRNLDLMRARGHQGLDRVVAAGGGAKTRLWLEIKAAAYGCPVLTVEEPECGVVGAAMLGAVGVGLLPDLDAAAAAMVRPAGQIEPDARAAETYARMLPLFDELHAAGAPFWDALDSLAAAAAAARP